MTVNDYSQAGTTADELQIIEVDNDQPKGTRVRGGAVLSGATVALATFVLLEMILLTSDLSGGQVSVSNPDTGSWLWDALAGIVAFFVGGMVAGASVPYKGADTGALNGVVTWAAAIAGIVLFTGLVGGAIFGALGDVIASQQANLSAAAQGTEVTEAAAANAREAAGWAAIALAVTLGATAFGGSVGAKMWPNSSNRSSARRS